MKKRIIIQTSFVLLILTLIVTSGNAKALDELNVYLPVTLRNYCPPFSDDFSNPNSGWDVVDDDFEHTEYQNGEYRVLTKQAGYLYFYQSPTCSREHYEVEVDARWAGEPGHSYGIIFGALPDFSQYYIIDINTEVQEFRVLRRDKFGGYQNLSPPKYNPIINSGTSSNHLKVTLVGDRVTLEINGMWVSITLITPTDGMTFAGVVSIPYDDQPISDARFDNFSISSINIPTTGLVKIGSILVDGKESGDADEWVQIFNHDQNPIQLKNWTLEDDEHHVFTFPYFVIQRNQSCRIYTNEIHPEFCGFNYGSNSEIWDDDGDHIYLRDANGTLVDELIYPIP